jgi:hypothetical protein
VQDDGIVDAEDSSATQADESRVTLGCEMSTERQPRYRRAPAPFLSDPGARQLLEPGAAALAMPASSFHDWRSRFTCGVPFAAAGALDAYSRSDVINRIGLMRVTCPGSFRRTVPAN